MTVRIEKNGPVWTVIHARPEARNAMNPENAQALYEAFLAFDADESASVAVFWGEGGAFCAGFDLKRVGETDPDRPNTAFDFTGQGDGNGGDIARAPMGPSRLELSKPVIAAVEGPAVAGGMELAVWCDIRVMGKDAYMGVYCRRWGVPLIDGGTVRLPRLIGQGRAMDLILTGRQVMAEECLAIGLCEYVVPAGAAREKAEQLARDIARFPQTCLRADRRSAMKSHGKPLRTAMAYEWENGRKSVSVDAIAGAARFAAGAGRHGDFGDI